MRTLLSLFLLSLLPSLSPAEGVYFWQRLPGGQEALFRDGVYLASWDGRAGILTTADRSRVPCEAKGGWLSSRGKELYYDPESGSLRVQPSGEDALEEVNAARAARGLRPFRHDPLLTVAARRAALARAAALCAGHTANDFAYIPPGGYATAAGCAAWEPGWGWGSCCSYENHTYAGAAWALGRDGRRYMHLYVR